MIRNKEESLKGIKLSGNCCVVCGWAYTDKKGNLLVVGAHVRPFRNISDYDHYDNIIGLCPNHHTEFDSGNITIDYHRGVSLHINKTDPYNEKKIFGKIDHINPGNLDYHIKKIFKHN